MRRGRGIRGTVAVGLLGAALAGCGVGASRDPVATPPPASVGPGTPVSSAVVQARDELVRALRMAGYEAGEPQTPYRPAEASAFAAAPRAVVQVLLADDPAHGLVSIYEFPSATVAAEAGREQAAYVGSGPGRVNWPPDTRFVVRQLGTTVLFYTWSPDNSPDPRAAGILPALETLGTEIAVPR